MLRCMSPDVTQSRRAEGQPRCPLLGVTRTSPSPWGRRDLCRHWCGPANSRTCSGLVADGAARGATTTARTPSSAAGVVLERKSIMVSSLISILQIRSIPTSRNPSSARSAPSPAPTASAHLCSKIQYGVPTSAPGASIPRRPPSVRLAVNFGHAGSHRWLIMTRTTLDCLELRDPIQNLVPPLRSLEAPQGSRRSFVAFGTLQVKLL